MRSPLRTVASSARREGGPTLAADPSSARLGARRPVRGRRYAIALALVTALAGIGAAPASAATPPGPKPPAPPSGPAVPAGALTADAASEAGASAAAGAAATGIARRPYMGWSSWSLQSTKYPGVNPNGSGSWLNEANVLKQVDVMASRLKSYGYQYINIDAGWSTTYDWQFHFDEYGREAADPQRFPHGMRYVADRIHAKGLKAGIYLPVGLHKPAYGDGKVPVWNAPGCTTGTIVYPDLRTTNGWDSSYKIDFSQPCAQKYVDSQAQLIADWGYDFLKIDGVGPGSFRSGDNYNNIPDITAWQQALKKTGRPIHLELSWSLDVGHAADWKKLSNGWRIETDVECYCDTLVTWDQSVKIRWNDVPAWTPWAGPGGYNDLDTLDVGNGEMDGLTNDERRSYTTLWAISASPLYSGDDLTKLDDYGLSLLTNREVIAVDQQGIPARPVTATGNAQVWGMRNTDGSYTVALFNMGSFPATVRADWTSFGFAGKGWVRDLWSHRELGVKNGGVAETVPAHGSRLFRVTPLGGPAKLTTYQAEAASNNLVGSARISACTGCAGRSKVGNLYNGGALRFNKVTVPATGTYLVNVGYLSGDPRSVTISANGADPVTLAFPSSGGWDTTATVSVPLRLHKGANTIEFDSSTAVYSPDIDQIAVPAAAR